jgi:hypothetical protein
MDSSGRLMQPFFIQQNQRPSQTSLIYIDALRPTFKVMRHLIRLLVLVFCCAACAADEGDWLFNAPPTAQIKAKYGFALTPEWLDHLRLASVRFDVGGSGAFVSADGLTLTNHHVAQDCLQALSGFKQDFFRPAFYAAHQKDELRCPSLELNVVEQISDVTDKINAAVRPGMDDATAAKARKAAMAAIEKDCASAADIRCDVITLYSGALYHLYRFKKYTDVRLVFTPEFQMAFFGGDPDNFEFPRYDLDIAFFRVYENGQPAHPRQYLRWSKDGAKEGDLVFAAGNPGSTARLYTMNQLGFLKDLQVPFQLKDYQRRLAVHQKFAAQSAENARIAQRNIFSLANNVKRFGGYLAALQEANLMHKKIGEERRVLIMSRRGPGGAPVFNSFIQIDHALLAERQLFAPYNFIEKRFGLRGELAFFARHLVRLAEEKQKPNGERLREYRQSALPSLEDELFSSAPIYKSLEEVQLADSLAAMQAALPDEPIVKQILASRSAEQAAKELIAGTRLDDVAFRRQLYAGGAAAIAASKDSLIVLMRDIDAAARVIRKRFDDEVDAVVERNGAVINRFRYQRFGPSTPPDATFSLRLSYGTVKGYVEDGRGIAPKGAKLPAFTDFAGAFAHSAEHANQALYDIPNSWQRAKSHLKLETPLNFVSTVDVIGGSSGSPLVNKNGDFVGIVFDGNPQALAWNYEYDDVTGRAISVDSRGILEALEKIYRAKALVKELTKSSQKKK